jgi:hypothetical protein
MCGNNRRVVGVSDAGQRELLWQGSTGHDRLGTKKWNTSTQHLGTTFYFDGNEKFGKGNAPTKGTVRAQRHTAKGEGLSPARKSARGSTILTNSLGN